MPSLAPLAWPRAGERQAELKAQYLLRLHALDLLDEVLRDAGAHALVVKGAALAPLYPKPWAREMSDVDLLIRPSDLRRVREALTRYGFLMSQVAERPLTETALEVAVMTPSAVAPVLVELHLGLDKVVVRRLSMEGLFARATAFSTYRSLLAPALEDQVLLIILHLASDEFRHVTGLVDLELLLSQLPDVEKLVRRAREWRATTACYVAFRTLDALLPGVVPADLLRALAPTVPRALAVATCFEVGAWPVARSPMQLGWRWIAKQTLLRDDTARWLFGVGAYGARRLLERSRQAMRGPSRVSRSEPER